MTTREEYEARREAVAARITADPQLFSMADWGRKTECGTVCCIAGHAVLEAGMPVGWTYNGYMKQYVGELYNVTLLSDAAAAYLGVPERDAYALFAEYAPHQDPESAVLALKQAPYVA